jgi:two-component system, NarL family, response regulator LiaR
MKLLLVDDNELVRQGLRRAIEMKTTFEVVEAASGPEAIAIVEKDHIDVVIMDVRMPGMDGIEATREIKALKPATYVLAISGYAEPAAVAGMLRAGASGYVLKGSLPDQFLTPLDAMATGLPAAPIEPLGVS